MNFFKKNLVFFRKTTLKHMPLYCETIRLTTCRLINTLKHYYHEKTCVQLEKCSKSRNRKSFYAVKVQENKCVDLIKAVNKLSFKSLLTNLKNNTFPIMDIRSHPTVVIENYFNQLAVTLNCEQLRLKDPSLKILYHHGLTYWCCQYEIEWPEQVDFCSIGSTKKMASENTAQAVVHYLHKKNLISSHGAPLIHLDKTLIQQMIRSNIRTYCTSSLRDQVNKQHDIQQKTIPMELNDEEYQKILKLFPFPKNVLDNIYQVIRNERGSISHKVTYKQIGPEWMCTYSTEWPEKLLFSVTAKKKGQASTRCASKILHYLLKNNNITKKGVPIMFNKEQIKLKTMENVPVLALKEIHMDMLKKIVDLNIHQVFPIISDQQKFENTEEDKLIMNQKQFILPRYIGINHYKCKEELLLPVSDYKEQIIDSLRENRVVVIKGEPGCGKSTRIPQYILEGWARESNEAKPCRIVVTEPRRIAAISLAERVASERNEYVGSIVGYQVRFKSNFQKKTGRILYCTNGILLQHLKSDPDLNLFTHVVVDEAHERDLNTDLLLNILRNIMKENPILKVIIMSATLDAGLFQTYFQGSKILHIPGFTYPVKSHFLDKCKLKIDKTLAMCNQSKPSVIHEDVMKVLMHLHKNKPEGAILCFLPGWEDIRKIRNMIPPSPDLAVMCLHSRLQHSDQRRIFSKLPDGIRKIILSTNIAETSVTVEDVVYVVDTGIHKETRLDVEKGLMCIDNHWISKSSVDQRKGRAGRVRPGECFHLYTKSKMESFPEFALPEILRMSLTKAVLDSKAFERDESALEFFDKLPTPPSQENVELALNELKDLELIDDDEKLTPLGRVVINFQLEPKLSKTLVNSVIFKCVTPIVDIITLFSSNNEIFNSSFENKESIRKLKASFSKTSDHLSLMRIFEIWNDLEENGNSFKAEQLCNDMCLQHTQMKLIKRLRDTHFDYIEDGLKHDALPISDDFSDEDEIVKAVILSGVGTFLTRKTWDIVKGRLKKCDNFFTRSNHKATMTSDTVNFRNISPASQFLLYINETRSNLRRTSLIRETSVISPLIVLLFSNKKLLLVNIEKDQFSRKLSSDDQVILQLANTNLSIFMDRKQASLIMQCKMAILSCYDFYIFELTKGGGRNEKVNELWHNTLLILRDLLNDFRN